jgi:SOS-response transcriptional repressor LexA
MLTPSHYELLSFIETYSLEKGFSPSFDEMKDAVGLTNKSGVHRLLKCLEERGYVRRLFHKARALEIIRRPGEPPSRSSMDAAFVSAAKAILPKDQLDAIRDLATALVGGKSTAQHASSAARKVLDGEDYGQRQEVL